VILIPKDTLPHPKDIYRKRKDFENISEALAAANVESRDRVSYYYSRACRE